MSVSGSARLVLMLAAAAPAAAQALTLQDALASAYHSNPKLLAARAQLKATDETVAQAQANWRPTISVQASDSYVNDRITGASDIAAQAYLRNEYPGDSYGLTVTQPIFRGGRTVAQIRQAKASVKEGEAELLSVEEQVLLSVITDYLDLARDQALLDLAVHREIDAKDQLAGAQDKLKGGEATRLDVATAEAALLDALVAHRQASAQEVSTSLSFARDTGLEPTPLAPTAPLLDLPGTLAESSDLAGSASFDVQEAANAARVAQAALSVAKGQGLPTISLQGTLLHQDGVTYPGESEQIEAASVQLKVPIYSGGLLDSQIRAARATVEQKRDLLDETRQAAEAQAGTAFAQHDYAARAEAGLTAKSQAMAISLEGVRRQTKAGERSLSDIIAAEEALFVVQIAVVQAHHDNMLAQYTLADSIGRLTARRLELPVDFYDPEKYLREISWGPGR